MATSGKNRKILPKEKSFLPDEIVTDILIRLPVKSLISCGLVCKRWGEIISARDFIDLHFKTSIPLIVVSTAKNFTPLHFFAFDKWWELARSRLPIHRFPNYQGRFPESTHIQFSSAGLIAVTRFMYPKREFYILNPARSSRECVKITVCDQLRESDICAVYYHPSLNEYCCLLKINESLPSRRIQSKQIRYKSLNLGSNPSLKAIGNPFTYKVKGVNAFPLFNNNCFYWMLRSDQDSKYDGCNDILEFDIISEDFRVIPCPIPLNTECSDHQTHLLNSSDGILSFVLVLPNTISIWRLEDRVKHLWTSTEYNVSIDICHSYQAVGIIALVDGILAFEHNNRLFLCNLKEGTVKNYPKRKYSGNVSFFSHQMSLASLKNCKSALYINKDLEVLEGPIPNEIKHVADKLLLDSAGGEKNRCTSGLGNMPLQHSRSSRQQILELTQQVSDLTNQNHMLNEKIQEMAARDAARDEEMAARDAARDEEMATIQAFVTRFGEDKGARGAS